MRKLTSILLAFIMVTLYLPIAVSANGEMTYWSDNGNYDTSWYYKNTSAKEYVLTTAEELAGLSVLVNNGNTFSGRTVKLGADINLEGHNWTPIGKYISDSNNNPFAGSFDGQDYSISNIVASGNYSALFSYVTAGFNIKNIFLENINLIGENNVAGIVAYANATGGNITVENCTVSGMICDDVDIYGEDYSKYTAGIISRLKTTNGEALIKNCNNYAKITCDDYGAGIVGSAEGNSNNQSVYIIGCHNYGNISAGNAAFYCGGISGFASNTKFELCANYGSVVGNYSSDDNGAVFFGGICGDGSASKFNNCANYGVVGAIYVSGIVNKSLSSSRNTVKNCLSVGEISYDAGIDGALYPISKSGDKIDNCYYRSGIVYDTSYNQLAGTAKVYLSNLKSGEVSYLLNDSTAQGDVVWGQNIDNGEPVQEYPVIGGAKVYFIDGKYTNAPEHNFDSGVVTSDATCTEDGEAIYTCLDCGYKFTEILNKHRYTSTTTIWPTHLEEGVETVTCNCGNIYTKPIAKLERHTYTSTVTKEPTHTEEGITTYTCECGDSYTKPIEKTTQHNYSRVVIPPTCSERGYTTYICECGNSYQTGYVDTSPHIYTSSITTQATHLTEGVETFRCKCGDYYTEIIPKLENHSYSSQITTTATHLSEGIITYTCTCGDVYTETIAKTKEHSYFVLNVVEPTCETEGYTTYMCECGHTYNGDKKVASGHNYSGDTCVDCGESKIENCSCNCHKGGFSSIIWKILRFFYKLFGTNKSCACGVAHY